jgi:Na+/melibiose symporter-like transporter
MHEGIIAVFIPIVLFIVTGLILVVFIYFRSRERQLLIEKGLSAESIKEFFESKRDPYTLMKIGIICLLFGISLGFGLMLEDWTSKEYYVPLMIFTGTGLGFILANILSRRLNKKETGV